MADTPGSICFHEKKTDQERDDLVQLTGNLFCIKSLMLPSFFGDTIRFAKNLGLILTCQEGEANTLGSFIHDEQEDFTPKLKRENTKIALWQNFFLKRRSP